MKISLGQLRRIVREEASRGRLKEGTDASTVDGVRFRGRFSSPDMVDVYRAADAALARTGGFIDGTVLDAAEEAGMASGADGTQLGELMSWLDDNWGAQVQERQHRPGTPSRDAAWKYFSI